MPRRLRRPADAPGAGGHLADPRRDQPVLLRQCPVSGQMTLEAQYLANKLAKGFIGTNQIESNSR
ncbi:hypothetical protein, partial [Nocardia sp. NPDC003648]